ncbi:MAG: helix-turn-helix domain-containing protein [bacterium]
MRTAHGFDITQQELANLVGSTQEMLSMTLNRFRRSGWIDVHRRYICLHNLEAVQAGCRMTTPENESLVGDRWH